MGIQAREDKTAVVRPLVFAMEKEGISCWVDEAEIAWGESITAKVNDVSLSRFLSGMMRL